MNYLFEVMCLFMGAVVIVTGNGAPYEAALYFIGAGLFGIAGAVPQLAYEIRRMSNK